MKLACCHIKLITGLILLLTQCGNPASVNLDVEAVPFKKLSDYHFFKGDLAQLTPNGGVWPYEVITPLFSDYAEKARFVWVPKGSPAKLLLEDENFEFPSGAVLIKNFFYYSDARLPEKGRQIIETRLLVKRKHQWDALTYIWNQSQTEAYLEITGDIKELSWINKAGQRTKISYVIPNKNQCKGCHEYKQQLQPIGPKIRYLNRDFSYSNGTRNQLVQWQEVGILTGTIDHPEDLPAVAAWNDTKALLQDRALAYLEINCGICHSENGPAYISGLYLTTQQQDPAHLGICKSPVSAGSGSGGRKYDIVPGHPESSILLYRMETVKPGEMMPELGRTVVHQEGVQLIREWIASLDGNCPSSL